MEYHTTSAKTENYCDISVLMLQGTAAGIPAGAQVVQVQNAPTAAQPPSVQQVLYVLYRFHVFLSYPIHATCFGGMFLSRILLYSRQ